jgi:hypothetical protein
MIPKGVNAFAINRAPRSDGKEALVLSASWMSRTGECKVFIYTYIYRERERERERERY